ncbi:P2X purinoceptor 3 isoform X2 [Passer domesticus]|uniref:P2X purinoceptor 3 isoform X2 n=1 Tax=Passer domesticus TaxID=48849 RepID=UPI0030FEED83
MGRPRAGHPRNRTPGAPPSRSRAGVCPPNQAPPVRGAPPTCTPGRGSRCPNGSPLWEGRGRTPWGARGRTLLVPLHPPRNGRATSPVPPGRAPAPGPRPAPASARPHRPRCPHPCGCCPHPPVPAPCPRPCPYRCRYRCLHPPCPARIPAHCPHPRPALPASPWVPAAPPCPARRPAPPMALPRPRTRWVSDFFSYETTKSVVVKSWVVGVVNRGVQLLILAYFVGWVFLHEKAYQVRDTAIESSVVTKVKGVGRYAGQVMDTADYVTPPQGTSVFVVVTKQIRTEEQAQGVCPESEAAFHCSADRDCRELSPGTSNGLLTGRCVPYNATLRTCEIQGWCPPEVDTVDVPVMLEAENFTLLIKNSIRFPLFGFEKTNLPPPGSGAELGQCRFHPQLQPLCPILRLGDVARLAGQDFPALAATGGVLGIKIGWVCDLDRAWERCLPRYSFTRLDSLARTPAPGYNFRYYRWPDGSERRTLIKAFGIRFDVLVYGSAGKFGIVPTLINTVAAFTSIGVGTVLCDIILLNFLKGAEHYKARKFEEVSEAGVPATPSACPPGALGTCSRDKQSTDSGTFSLGL